MCEVAAGHLGMVIDDIVPGHTGKGSDFRLAEMKVGDYPGIYHMVEIEPKDWHLLPTVSKGDSINLDLEAEDQLAKHGYIIGRMQRVIFYEPGVQGHQLERDRAGARPGWSGATLGLSALLQGGPALDQLARPELRRYATGDRRCAALVG